MGAGANRAATSLQQLATTRRREANLRDIVGGILVVLGIVILFLEIQNLSAYNGANVTASELSSIVNSMVTNLVVAAFLGGAGMALVIESESHRSQARKLDRGAQSVRSAMQGAGQIIARTVAAPQSNNPPANMATAESRSVSAPADRYCPSCGQGSSHEAAYCARCGKALPTLP
jgi:hypothetical protein